MSAKESPMLLIQVQQWLGPSLEALESDSPIEEKTTIQSFSYRGELETAIIELSRYKMLYNQHFKRTAINFTLLSFQTIEGVCVGALQLVNVQPIELLATSFED